MNEFIAALILAIVQGITEWFPVSSSGHLALTEHFLGYDGGLLFGIALHFGTLMAVFVYFGRDITDILREVLSFRFNTPNGRLGLLLFVASIPAAIFGFLLRDVVKSVTGNLALLALGFLITSIVLFVGSAAPRRTKKLGVVGALFIGCMQVFSLFRGISRSGMTIGAGLLSGLNEKEAIRFSYLLSVPLILGANTFFIGNRTLPPDLLWATLVAFFVSLGVMHFSFTYVLNKRENLRWIGCYVLFVALLTGAYLVIA